MRIGTKLLLLSLLLVMSYALVNFTFLTKRLHGHLDASQQEWVNTLAHGISEGLARDTIDGHALHARDIIRALVEKDRAIEYIYLTDFDGNLFTHSFDTGLPRVFQEHIDTTHAHGLVHTDAKTVYRTAAGNIVDYQVEVIDGLAAHLHIGLNENEINDVLAEVDRDIFWLTILIMVLGAVIATVVSRRISRPLGRLTKVVDAYAKGDAGIELQDASGDKEIVRLLKSFNAMFVARRHAEQALLQSQRNLGLTLDSIGDGVIATDRNGRISRMNPVAEELTGWSQLDAVGRQLDDVFTIYSAVDGMPMTSPVVTVLETGEVVELANHTVLINRHGDDFQIADSAAPIRDEQGEIMGVILVFRDVTEEYALRTKVQENEQRLQSILDNTPAVIYVKDLDGRFLLVNRQFETLFHKSNDEMCGKLTHDLFPKDVADQHRANDREVLQSRKPIEYEETAPHDDGMMHTYHSVKFCLNDEQGEPYAVCGISTDITQQKSQEEQLRRSQKMEALGKLTGGIAHDFNNMLNVVTGYAEILNRSLESEPKLQKFAMEIRHAGERGSAMTAKLLSFSRDRAVSEEKVDVNEMLLDERDMLRKTLTPRINLRMKLANSTWPIWLDRNDLEDAIINIAINAMHAIPDSGELVISTENVVLGEQQAKQLYLAAGEYMKLSIKDNGLGMSDEVRSRIFDPFFTTKGEQGTGLGLSQVYGFVQRSSGAIRVESEQGKGTCFELYFPHFSGNSFEVEDEDDVDPGQWRGNETILVVDDEPSLCMLAEELLTASGYRVLIAESGARALEVLASENVDLLLTDVIMPEMDGYQLISKAREMFPGLKIQIASGYTDDRLEKEGTEELRRHILYKPYTPEQLLGRVREILDEK